MASGKVNGVGNLLDGLMGASGDTSSPGKLSRASLRAIEEYQDALTNAGIKSKTKVADYEKLLIKQEAKEREKYLKEVAHKVAKETGTATQKALAYAAEMFGNALGKSLNSALSSVDSYIKSYTQYMSSVTTRLQGSGLTYKGLTADIGKNLATSPYLKQTDMLTNLNKFVESGIAYNLETRAYIATATSKIATTFDAFDSSLLRLIRIQQADSTVARLGMESLLTKFLNARYEDTSYLNNSGSVTASLLEAESLMGLKGATEFEYAVQRWLGSMSSLGVSSNTINMIAQGLGYLGSGNISALSSNSSLQNLFAMASGGSYGNLLTGGLTAGSASDIIRNIVGLGQNIAMSGNNVVMSQFASLFGLSISDLVSLLNITTEDVKEITKGIVDYEKLRNETTNQLATMGQRTMLSEMVENVLSNAMSTIGQGIANDPAMYALWELATIMGNSGIDTTIEAAPFGIGMSMSISQLLKTGVVGFNLGTTLLPAVLGNLFGGNLGGTNLSVWNEVQSRGNGLGLVGTQSGVTTSGSSYIGSMDSSDIQNTFSESTQSTEYTGERDNKGGDDLKAIREMLEGNSSSRLEDIYNLLSSWDLFIKFRV